jgi:hypothetical protein
MLEDELMARDRWCREDLLAYQRLTRTSTGPACGHPLALRPRGVGADAAERPLAELPTMPKATLMAEFDRVVTDPRLRLADLQALSRRQVPWPPAVDVQVVPALQREPGRETAPGSIGLTPVSAHHKPKA